MRIIVTGGAGFIGSHLIKHLILTSEYKVLNLDKLTYASNLNSLKEIQNNKNYSFVQADISNYQAIEAVLESFKPNSIMNLAAESHVDRSIDDASSFIQTNIIGTFTLLECARKYWKKNNLFKFHHISTDEVYGSLSNTQSAFTEQTAYSPNSPYSSSKASSDHLVRAWHHTYGLPILITNCSNNYGPYQIPEKLIPLSILNALELKKIPVYGRGENIRDWLYVEDHVKALKLVLEKGKIGETYNIGGRNEIRNIDVVKQICSVLDHLMPKTDRSSYAQQITFVQDRPGHDQRYAINCQKIEKELGWIPNENFESGLEKTIKWYVDCYKDKTNPLTSETFRHRLGTKL